MGRLTVESKWITARKKGSFGVRDNRVRCWARTRRLHSALRLQQAQGRASESERQTQQGGRERRCKSRVVRMIWAAYHSDN
ncbi:hypothetical protein NDU88_004006 [Pleurodeles waltl]|uniref:Uncharacterized protein n=1 Tax=Pleurodeles waltl TaxID=8319 RepID=A0AAV7KWJ6_PLEWA|nr:hypothetical protein NDU88_004006 [Pleurodeles waltl]